jgi:hypothetical protein
MSEPFVAKRDGIYQLNWGGFPPGTPEDAVREWTGTLSSEEVEFALGPEPGAD